MPVKAVIKTATGCEEREILGIYLKAKLGFIEAIRKNFGYLSEDQNRFTPIWQIREIEFREE